MHNYNSVIIESELIFHIPNKIYQWSLMYSKYTEKCVSLKKKTIKMGNYF